MIKVDFIEKFSFHLLKEKQLVIELFTMCVYWKSWNQTLHYISYVKHIRMQ